MNQSQKTSHSIFGEGGTGDTPHPETVFPLTACQAAIQKAHLHPAMEVAVIGAGLGCMGEQLSGLVRSVHLLAHSPSVLTAAQRASTSYKNISFHSASGTSLPFPNDSLDALFVNRYLEDCLDPPAMIQELSLVLKPGGRLVLMEEQGSGGMEQETGFERAQLRSWLEQAGLVNLVIENIEQTADPAGTASGTANAAPKPMTSLVVATGTRRVRARELVQAGYAARAESGGSCCGGTEPSEAASGCCIPISVIPPDALLEGIQIPAGYSPADAAAVPVEAANLSLGCGNPTALANLQPGETVLDIGSGGGIDVFLAARKVGPSGRVIGVDMTPAMLEMARRTAEKAGLTNVEFRQGYAEALPAEDNSVDVIISNCVINLTEDKGLAWREAYRVLKPGGRVEVSDVATDISLPPHLRLDARGWAECVTGALPLAETVDLMQQAGFTDILTHPSPESGTIEGVKVFSTYFSARK